LKLVMLDQHDGGDRETVLHYPHRQYLAPRVRVVVDALLDHFATIDDLHVMARDVAQYAAVPAAEAAPRQSASLRRKTSRSGSDAAAS
jgi:hypothetical protein